MGSLPGSYWSISRRISSTNMNVEYLDVIMTHTTAHKHALLRVQQLGLVAQIEAGAGVVGIDALGM